MTVNVEVIPTIDKFIEWGSLSDTLVEMLKLKGITIKDEINLFDFHNKRHVNSNELIDSGTYVLECEGVNTLSFFRMKKDESDSTNDDKEDIDDYGKNLSLEQKQELYEKWCAIPFSYYLSSGGGRTLLEPKIMIVLASALARHCNGMVIMNESSFFKIETGIYNPEELMRLEQ